MVSIANLDDPNDAGKFIVSSWLEDWANSEAAPKPIDNTRLLCCHGKLNPGQAPHMKRISTPAWEYLQVSPACICKALHTHECAGRTGRIVNPELGKLMDP